MSLKQKRKFLQLQARHLSVAHGSSSALQTSQQSSGLLEKAYDSPTRGKYNSKELERLLISMSKKKTAANFEEGSQSYRVNVNNNSSTSLERMNRSKVYDDLEDNMPKQNISHRTKNTLNYTERFDQQKQ